MKLWVCCVLFAFACQSAFADWVRQPFWYDDARRDKVAKGTVWPQPKNIQTTTQSLSLDPDSFSVVTSDDAANSAVCKDVIDPGIERYRGLLFWIPADERVSVSGDSVLDRLRVTISGTCTKYPSLDSDESYTLTVPASGEATLSAQTAWGALRGLETFSQLVYEVDGKHKLNVTTIDDEPRFPHRGVMLDTARHFIAVPYIIQNLDAMAYNKINVFHWHMVDDQSFPFQSTTYPDLSGKGAYTQDNVYSPEDVRSVVEYARMRGIRVIPEFDSPGHMQSWGQGHPDLLTSCSPTSIQQDIYHLGPANVARNSTYDFMQRLFQEIREVFADEYLHLGGDEVHFQCWMSNDEIQQFMQQQGFPNTTEGFAKLEGYYIHRLINILKEFPKRTRGIVWQEIFDNNIISGDFTIDLDTIIHVWQWNNSNFQGIQYWDELPQVTAAGYRAILSSCWYLNFIDYGRDWPKYYECDPHNFTGSPQQKELVIGGEAPLWAEWVDATNVVARLWPRASAVAERLWSPQNLRDATAASPRMEEHRCRMVRRGIRAQPQGPSYCKYEWNRAGEANNIPTASGAQGIMGYVQQLLLLFSCLVLTFGLC
ncbi:beta-hexosaminidase subunit beta-like [Branchiostoma lanceolatum]|uniref:beta-hexosaminidase subunit beta-like n=1 Tax=Branchiostoma lanceolatum TaxID=7740 RepID=UPI0034534ACF